MDKYDETVNKIREFNRFYTVNMGFLNSKYLDSKYSVAETRILFEIKIGGECIQNDIVKKLHIDKSYLSRIIQQFCIQGLAEKSKSDCDKRITKITLTELGNSETERLIELTNGKIKSQIEKLSFEECGELFAALNKVISILGQNETK